jgi:uncharacterized repeat protein (TIGR01451 family)
LVDNLPTGPGVGWSISPANASCSIAVNVLSCSFGDLAAGASASVHVQSPTTTASCKDYPNTGSASATNAATVEASDTVTVECASLTVSKVADADVVDAGTSIGFTVTVHSGGPATAQNVVLSDALPTGSGITWAVSPAVSGCSISSNTLTCNFGDLASGASASVHVQSPTTSASCKVYPNTASASADNHAGVQASDTVAVRCPSLSLSKTADAATVTAGNNIGFTLNLASNGPGTATSVVLTDALPTGAGITWSISPGVAGCAIASNTLTCTFGNLAAGASRSVHLSSPTTVQSCATYANTAKASATNHGEVSASASVVVTCPPPPPCPAVGAVPALNSLTSLLFLFTDGSVDANWQGASKGFAGEVWVNGLLAKERTSGNVPYSGTIHTNDTSLGAWQAIVNANPGRAFASVANGSNTNVADYLAYEADLMSAFAQINAKAVTSGYASRSAVSLNGLNTQNGIGETFVINVTSGFQVSSQINITGDANDVFILRWDTDANFSNGYQGQVKFQSGGAIVPLGGLSPANFIHVAGDINASGGGSNPPPPYPQGPGGGISGNWNGGGFFTGYWLTTGNDKGETSSLSNAIFVGGWYSTTLKFSMTSGTSGVNVPCK